MTNDSSARRSPVCASVAAACRGAVFVCVPATAEAAQSVDLTAEQTAAVKEIDELIQWLQGAAGRVHPGQLQGQCLQRRFLSEKPGKMRFEYAAPNPFIIVSDGTWVTIKNRAKDKADQYPLSQTPLGWCLDDDINLLKEANILDVENKAG